MSEPLIAPASTRWFAFAGEVTGVISAGAQTGGAYALLQGTKSPGSATPIHRHEVESETVCMLSGRLTLQTEAGAFTLDAGEVATLPRTGVHRLVNVDESDASYLLLCAPANFEAFVEAVSPPLSGPDARAPAPGPQDIQRLVAVAPAFGIEILPPTSLPPAANAGRTTKPASVTEVINVLGLHLEVLGTADDEVVFFRSVLTQGQSVPLHRHPEPETFHVLEGEIEIYGGIGGEGVWTRLGPGCSQTVAPGTPHALRNAKADPATILGVAPRRIVSFFRDAQAALAACEPGQEGWRLEEVCRDYGYDLMSSAQNAAIGLSGAA